MNQPCLDCGTLVPGSRCRPCRALAEARRNQAPGRRSYFDPGYRAYRSAVLRGRPTCALCGTEGADTLDHIVPVSRGGTNDPANLRPAHRACNSGRRDALES